MDSSNASSSAPAGETGREQAPRRGVRPRVIFLILLVGVIGPCSAAQAPLEIGRWHFTQAVKLRAAGEKAAAMEKLAEAMRWLPRSSELMLTKAEWLLEEGKREEALAAADQALEVAAESFLPLLLHAQFLQNAGEFKDAVPDWHKIARLSDVSGRPPRATAKNGLAYAQALANVELDKALENVGEALDHDPSNSAFLDTRAFIYYLQARSLPAEEGKDLLQSALEDMDTAVPSMDRLLARATPTAEHYSKPVKAAYDARPKALRDMDQTFASAQRSSAVMHYHRALILEALGRKKEAAAERGVAERLIGQPPDETLF